MNMKRIIVDENTTEICFFPCLYSYCCGTFGAHSALDPVTSGRHYLE